MGVFVGLVAMAKFEREEGRSRSMSMSLLGAVVVTFTLAVNLSCGDPIVSLLAAALIAAGLHRLWVWAGRPCGIAQALSKAETEWSPC